MKKFMATVLNKMGCKDLSLMKYGLTHFKFGLFLDGLFIGKYQYIGSLDPLYYEFANKYKNYLDNKKYKDNLISSLDKESIDTINLIENNVTKVLKSKEKPYINKHECGITDDGFKIIKYIENYKEDIFLPVDYHCTTSFYYKHGITHVDNLNNLLKGKDIIDCGSYIGDSAMMFSKELGFSPLKHIYCLEPDLVNGKLLEQTIKKNKKYGEIVHIPLGVGKRKEKLYLNSSGSTSVVEQFKGKGYCINIDTIDNIVKNYKINPGLIKWDIEGMEYDSLLGAEKTIKKYKPVLLISIYHNGRDFYEIKPLLESRNLGYKFKIRHLSNDLFFETMLICF